MDCSSICKSVNFNQSINQLNILILKHNEKKIVSLLLRILLIIFANFCLSLIEFYKIKRATTDSPSFASRMHRFSNDSHDTFNSDRSVSAPRKVFICLKLRMGSVIVQRAGSGCGCRCWNWMRTEKSGSRGERARETVEVEVTWRPDPDPSTVSSGEHWSALH